MQHAITQLAYIQCGLPTWHVDVVITVEQHVEQAVRGLLHGFLHHKSPRSSI